jgi:hypothetical protein
VQYDRSLTRKEERKKKKKIINIKNMDRVGGGGGLRIPEHRKTTSANHIFYSLMMKQGLSRASIIPWLHLYLIHCLISRRPDHNYQFEQPYEAKFHSIHVSSYITCCTHAHRAARLRGRYRERETMHARPWYIYTFTQFPFNKKYHLHIATV